MKRDEEGDLLLLNLVDIREKHGSGSWYDVFQGSAGGSATEAFLVATFTSLHQ